MDPIEFIDFVFEEDIENFDTLILSAIKKGYITENDFYVWAEKMKHLLPADPVNPVDDEPKPIKRVSLKYFSSGLEGKKIKGVTKSLLFNSKTHRIQYGYSGTVKGLRK